LCTQTDTNTYNCIPLNYKSGSWTRVTNDNVGDAGGGVGNFFIGNASLFNGGTARGAGSVYLFGAQCTNGTSAGGNRTTSYIPTNATSAGRSADLATVAFTAPASSAFSVSAQVVSPSVVTQQDTAFYLVKDASNSILDYVNGTKNRLTVQIAGASTSQDSALGFSVSAVNWVGGKYDGADQSSCLNGACSSAAQALSMFSGSFALHIGQDNSGGVHAPDGVVKNICYDVSPLLCVTQ
jgi:hypothetical protein